MKKYMCKYIQQVDKRINDNDVDKYFAEEHLNKIQFFQHERLIHLIVTLFFTLFFLMFFYFSFFSHLCLIIVFVLAIFLIFYVTHYFRLENGVQYMYKQYDKIKEKEIK